MHSALPMCVWHICVCASRKVNDINGGWLAGSSQSLPAGWLAFCLHFVSVCCLPAYSFRLRPALTQAHNCTQTQTHTHTNLGKRGLLGARLSVCREKYGGIIDRPLTFAGQKDEPLPKIRRST